MNVFCDKDKSFGGPETTVLSLFLFSGLNKNSYVEVITPRISECDFGNKVLVDAIKMRS